MSTYQIISTNPRVQAFYVALRNKGESHNMAEICALRRAPGIETDDTFLAGFGTLADQFSGDEKQLQQRVNISEQHGYKPNVNDVYIHGLARFPGDPEAFVGHGKGKGHIKKLLEKRGWSADGAVKVKGRPSEPDDKPKLADSIGKQLGRRMVKKDPALLKVGVQERKQAVIAAHALQ